MWRAVLMLVAGVWSVASAGGHRDVVTRQGAVRGRLASLPPHYAYLGVPYARWTRRDRFKAPKPPKKWDGTFEAMYHVKCPQADGEGDENCLVINIFTPVDGTSLPVLVHVHDGGFHSGWGAYEPPHNLLNQGFVVVTFNYRLGAFGFLCLGSPEAPGNAGLKDQVAALYWVHKNIAAFGGNSSDVTVYGTGTGAVSVELLLLSGVTTGLFHRAILESGSSLAPTSVAYDPISIAFEAAKALGYEGSEDIKDLLMFYQRIEKRNLTSVSSMFGPCIESNVHYTSSLLEGDPVELFQQESYQKVPILSTYTNNEINYLVESNSEVFEHIPRNFEKLLPNNLEFDDESVKSRVAEIIKEIYFGDLIEQVDSKKNYKDYVNDIFVEYPIIKSVTLHADKSRLPVFLMEFMNNNLPRYGERKYKIIDYIFSKESPDSDLIIERLVRLWSNFIKYGDPTPISTLQIPVIWQPKTPDSMNYRSTLSNVPGLQFGQNLVMKESIANQRILVWDHIYKRFYKLHSNSDKQK